MNDRLRPPSSGPAGRGRVHRQIAPAPQNEPLISSMDIQPAHGSLRVIPEHHDQLADDSLELALDLENVTLSGLGGIDMEDLDSFIEQLGRQAYADARSWNAVEVTEPSSQSISHDSHLTDQSFLASLSTATLSQAGSSFWDESSARSVVTDVSASTKCEICSTQCNSTRQKERHRRTVHGKKFRCKCSYETGRRDNYMRHLKGCRMKNDADLVFTCSCNKQTNVFDKHSAHLQDCRLQAGRRPNSSRQVR